MIPRQFALFFSLLLLCGGVQACSRTAEGGKPVATPSVQLSRSDASVGSPLDMTYRFAVAPDAPALADNYLVFVHFMDADGEQLWTDDHEPPTQTRQWKPGQTIEYTRTVFIPKFPYVGVMNIELGLYSPTSGDRLPLAGKDLGMRAYQVASFNMSRQSESLFVIFKDGWHQAEVAEDGATEWQWSKKAGVLTFRNPKRDAQLFLQLDQPVSAFTDAQRVDVAVGQSVVDSFTLPQGRRELRRISLPAATLGSADTVEITLSVDKTFVPAQLANLRSSDQRELGIRVFRAYVEPKEGSDGLKLK